MELLSVLALIVCTFAVYLWNRGDKQILKQQIKDLELRVNNFRTQSDDFENKWMNALDHNKELIRQKSSQATKSGNYIETLSPILEKFPANIFDPNTSVKWLGDPIDFIAFNFETPEIIFIEVKSGDANLSQRQKIIKKAIREGMVRFTEFRMNTDGTIETT
jgi:predicted Holliday junction resolvase-like endonuclease